MVITVDSSVLFQALHSSLGASHAIFRLIRRSELQLAISVPVFEEYQDLLSRPSVMKQMRLSERELETVLDFIAFVGVASPIHYLWRPNLRDETDNMFIELAVASGSEYVVTRNIRDFTIDTDLDLGIQVVTPAVFMRQWRQTHG